MTFPTFKDGSPAHTRARVRGHCHEAGRVVEGFLIHLIPEAAAHNAQIVYPILILPPSEDGVPVASLAVGWASTSDLEKV